jgi:hypothetical protein
VVKSAEECFKRRRAVLGLGLGLGFIGRGYGILFTLDFPASISRPHLLGQFSAALG